jgi:creatinine amidohydrolase
MSDKHLTEHRYEKLTWPEINDAIAAKQICIIPCSAVEQHGPHLPLDVDMLLSNSVALEAGRQRAEKTLVLPSVSYGYTGHVMDFPGTINVHYQHFIDQVLDITKSLAYHGFKKILLLNGHGSNMPNLDLVARRCNLETDAECGLCAWWHLLTVDPDFLPGWRESEFPGGCAHACELETAMYLHLDPENVRQDVIKSGDISYNTTKSPYRFTDIYGVGAINITSWTASYSDTGVLGDAEKGTAEKGKAAFEEAVKHLCGFIDEWHPQPPPSRHEAHAQKPTIPMPWSQADSLPLQ